MNANFVSSFLQLDLIDDGVEDYIKCLDHWGDRQWKGYVRMSSFVEKEAQCACKNKLVFVC